MPSRPPCSPPSTGASMTSASKPFPSRKSAPEKFCCTSTVVAFAAPTSKRLLPDHIPRPASSAMKLPWSDKACSLARQAAALSRDDGGVLQAEAAASLGGLDARAVKAMPFAATSLKFDPRGGRLYMAGPAGLVGVLGRADRPAQRLGPVGTARSTSAPRQTCQLGWSPGEPNGQRSRPEPGRPRGPAGHAGGIRSPPRAWDVTPDASRAAACLSSDRGRGVVAVGRGVGAAGPGDRDGPGRRRGAGARRGPRRRGHGRRRVTVWRCRGGRRWRS